MTDPTTHPRLAPVLAGILEQPDDDVRRLAFADALEEFGDNDDQFRAEFVRVQVELAKSSEVTLRLCDDAKMHSRAKYVFGVADPKHLQGLRRRERELLNADTAVGWTNGVHAMLRGNGVGVDVLLDGTWQANDNWALYFRRGFVEKVKLSAAACLLHLDDVRRQQPVRHVTLTTNPMASGERLKDGRWRVWFQEAPGKAVVTARPPALSRTQEWLLERLFPGIEFTPPSEAAGVLRVQTGTDTNYASLHEYGAARRPRRPFLGDKP